MQLLPEHTENKTEEETLEEPPTNKRGFIPIFKNKRFLTLWSGQVFSQLADKVYLVLMIGIIASNFQENNQSISSWVSLIMIAFTIPAILFGSLAGVFVDRWPKKEVLVISNLGRGFLVLILPILLSIFKEKNLFFSLPMGFWALLAVTFLVSTLTQFFAPAEQATIPLIVRRRYLLAANSLYTTTMMVLLIIGFAIGEPLLALSDHLITSLGFSGHFGKELVVGGSYVIAGVLLLILKTGEKRENLASEKPHVFADIWDGIKYLRANHKVRNALVQLVILFSVFAALAVLAVRLAETIPGMRAEQFGFLLASAGMGMGISAAILGHWGTKFSHIKLSLWGSMGFASSLLGLALFTHSLPLELLMTALLGGFAALIGVPMQTTIQSETPPIMRGKVFGLQNNAVNIALSLPLALAGIAETEFGLQPVLFSLSILAVIGGILNWLLQLRMK
jgi:MFS family permease